MMTVSRRTFLGGSGALACAAQPRFAWAQQCAASYVPASLVVNCAARKNYQIFSTQSDRVHLTGLVSLVNFTGKFGRYTAGTIFLFPVLRPAHQQPKPQTGILVPEIMGLIPRSATLSVTQRAFAAGLNEEALISALEPAGYARQHFLGFRVDVPAKDGREKLKRFTEGKLPDGKSIRIEWTVSNLNRPLFAGSPTIPADRTCSGAQWRKVIIEALKQAAAQQCA